MITRALRLALLAAALSLAAAGCSLLQPPTRYDPIEVTSYIEIWQWGERLREGCGDMQREMFAVSGMKVTAERLEKLTKYGPDQDSRKVFAAVQKIIIEIHSGESEMFCEEAATNVKAAAERALRAVGGRPR